MPSATTPADVRIVDLTRELATELARHIPDYQRKIRPEHVDRLARDMTNGNWYLSPDAVSVVANGAGPEALENGQHRVLARMKADPAGPVPVIMLSRTDQDIDRYLATDTGMRRSFADYLKAIGEPDYFVTAAMASRCAQVDLNNGIYTNNKTPTQSEIAQWFEGNNGELFHDMRKIAHRVYSAVGGNMTTLGGVFFIAARDFDREMVEAFAHDLQHGYGTSDKSGKDPAVLLRDQYQSWKAAPTNPPGTLMWNVTVKAWHLYVAGERRKILRWTSRSIAEPVVTDWMRTMRGDESE